MVRLLCIISVLFYSFNLDPDYLEWSEAPLKFSDFKGTAPKNSASPVNLATMISFQTRQVQGSPPEITIFNRMDRNSSWMSKQKEDILRIQQIHFNTSELYARKIRKEMKKMNDSKITEKEKYSDVIKKYTKTLHNIQKSKKVLLEDQPNLIKLWDKQIRDSLNMFKSYAK